MTASCSAIARSSLRPEILPEYVFFGRPNGVFAASTRMQKLPVHTTQTCPGRGGRGGPRTQLVVERFQSFLLVSGQAHEARAQRDAAHAQGVAELHAHRLSTRDAEGLGSVLFHDSGHTARNVSSVLLSGNLELRLIFSFPH